MKYKWNSKYFNPWLLIIKTSIDHFSTSHFSAMLRTDFAVMALFWDWNFIFWSSEQLLFTEDCNFPSVLFLIPPSCSVCMSNPFLDNRLYQRWPPMTSPADNFKSKQVWTSWKKWLMCDVCVSVSVCFRTWMSWAVCVECSFDRAAFWATFRRANLQQVYQMARKRSPTPLLIHLFCVYTCCCRVYSMCE